MAEYLITEQSIRKLRQEQGDIHGKLKELQAAHCQMQDNIGSCILSQLHDLVLWRAQATSEMLSFKKELKELITLRSQISNLKPHESLEDGPTGKATPEVNAASEVTKGDVGMPAESSMESIKYDLESLRMQVNQLRAEAETTKDQAVANEHDIEVIEENIEVIEEELETPKTRRKHFYNASPIALEESVWDGAIFIGVRGYSTMSGGTFSFVLVLLNTVMQVAFVSVVVNFLDVAVIDEEVVQGLRTWRLEVGHHLDWLGSGDQSLISRLCSSDTSLGQGYYQQQVLNMANGFLASRTGASQRPQFVETWARFTLVGPVLSTMCMLIWVLNVSTEIQRVYDLSKAFWRMPRGHCRIAFKDGGFHLLCISQTRLLWIAMLMLARVGIAGFLLYAGLGFLANTLNLDGLLLNAVALDFILNVDAIIFEAMAPLHMKNLIVQLEPLPVPTKTRFHGIDVQSPLVFGISAILVIRFVFSVVVDNADLLYEAHSALCSGSLDFVQTELLMHPFTGWARTKPAGFETYPAGEYWLQQVQHTKRLPLEVSISLITGDKTNDVVAKTRYYDIDFSERALVPASQIDFRSFSAMYNPHCIDIVDDLEDHSSRALTEKILDSMQGHRREGRINEHYNCSVGKDVCDQDTREGALSRFFCAQKCGCHSPSSDQILRPHGCPSTCHETISFRRELRRTCEDSTVPDLQMDSKWQAYKRRYAQYAKRAAKDRSKSRYDLVYEWITRNLTSRGCLAVHEMETSRDIMVDLCQNLEEGSVGLQHWCPQACRCEKGGHGCSLACVVSKLT